METMKVCTNCKEERVSTDFYRQHGKYVLQCKTCLKSKISERYCKNSESINLKKKEERKLNPGLTLYYNARQRARRNNLPFDLKVSDIFVPDFCPVLGMRLEVSDKIISPNSTTLDKIVPKLGYIRGNIQVISNRANSMKHDASISDMMLFARWVLNNFEETE
jgi:hypothetical protein